MSQTRKGSQIGAAIGQHEVFTCHHTSQLRRVTLWRLVIISTQALAWSLTLPPRTDLDRSEWSAADIVRVYVWGVGLYRHHTFNVGRRA